MQIFLKLIKNSSNTNKEIGQTNRNIKILQRVLKALPANIRKQHKPKKEVQQDRAMSTTSERVPQSRFKSNKGRVVHRNFKAKHSTKL